MSPDYTPPALSAEMDLRAFDVVLINTSGGKDSQTTLRQVAHLAEAQGVLDRLVVVHADMGRMEWDGAPELAEEQADHYGLPFIAVHRPQGDLLDHVLARRMWPSSTARYCTSDHKRGQVAKVVTRLVNERRDAGVDRPRILNVMGLRAEESPARAKKAPVEIDKRQTNGRREVVTWLPILRWTEAQVWADIRESGVPHHSAYDEGMPRLSCVFCPFAPESALLIAGRLNPAKLDAAVAIEEKIGHSFKRDLSLADVKAKLEAGAEAPAAVTWVD